MSRNLTKLGRFDPLDPRFGLGGPGPKTLFWRSILPKSESNRPSFVKFRDVALPHMFVAYMEILLNKSTQLKKSISRKIRKFRK